MARAMTRPTEVAAPCTRLLILLVLQSRKWQTWHTCKLEYFVKISQCLSHTVEEEVAFAQPTVLTSVVTRGWWEFNPVLEQVVFVSPPSQSRELCSKRLLAQCLNTLRGLWRSVDGGDGQSRALIASADASGSLSSRSNLMQKLWKSSQRSQTRNRGLTYFG